MFLDRISKVQAPCSLGEIAYKTIKEQLLELDLVRVDEKDPIDERSLAMRLGISRTPLREAINRLISEGFLKVVPRKGVYVVRKSKKEILEILVVRTALEGMAARLAVKYVTQEDIRNMGEIFSPFDTLNKMRGKYLSYADANIEFHEFVLKISRCEKLIELATSIFDHMRWIRFRAAAFEERLPQTHQEHLKIIEAIEKKDAVLAERRMRSHIEGLAQYIEEKVRLSS